MEQITESRNNLRVLNLTHRIVFGINKPKFDFVRNYIWTTANLRTIYSWLLTSCLTPKKIPND